MQMRWLAVADEQPTRLAFQDAQYALTAHIRDPENVPAPDGIEDRRLAIYRELFYNNTESLLAGTFPVLRQVMDDASWHALIRDYFAHHQSHTPLFLEIPREFLRYLQEERGQRDEDAPYLLELAHYEWVELAVQILEDQPAFAEASTLFDLIDGVPLVSPCAWTLCYSFPVHQIQPDFKPDSPPAEPTFLVVYRDRQDKVGFLQINAVTARLLELLDTDHELTGRAALTTIASELKHPKPQTVIDSGQEILNNLYRHDIVIGTRQGS